MEEAEQQHLPLPAAGAPAHAHQLLDRGFRLAEGKFTLRNVVDPVAHYYHVLASLSQDAVPLVWLVLHEETGPRIVQQSLHLSAGLSLPHQLLEDGEDDEAATPGGQEAVRHAGRNARVLSGWGTGYCHFCLPVFTAALSRDPGAPV
jgi:hypothetical protein